MFLNLNIFGPVGREYREEHFIMLRIIKSTYYFLSLSETFQYLFVSFSVGNNDER